MSEPITGQPQRIKPRIRPGSRTEIGWVNYMIARSAGVGLGVSAPNLFLTLARHRGLFRAWLRFAGKLMPAGRLPRADTELMILRTAHNCDSAYEWRAHESLARGAGLTEDQILDVRRDSPGSCLSAHQRLLLRCVDELHANRVLNDENWSSLHAGFNEAQLIELCMLVGHYEMLAMTLNSLRVELDVVSPQTLPLTARLVQRMAGRGRPASHA